MLAVILNSYVEDAGISHYNSELNAYTDPFFFVIQKYFVSLVGHLLKAENIYFSAVQTQSFSVRRSLICTYKLAADERNNFTVNITGISFIVTIHVYSLAQQPNAGQGRPILAVSRSHTPQSVGLLWTSDRPIANTST